MKSEFNRKKLVGGGGVIMIIAYIEFGIAILSCVAYALYSIWLHIPKNRH